ncbi:rhomboid family intramembrane serine protease [Pleionea sp. CnH1-48]|uniref:rhomboid family intramembrane serine protease n=1 Tax=Pleionea sp. CnH1-48 TaxID=2954494 RepID=UPI00209778F0|nr:rhomboid family intramembrane serine protease [Pleionea sp. CnH1-48]MCO7225186.1 rhomboid family intramembrane serine protease [Pleionea sp. CnH1-48]
MNHFKWLLGFVALLWAIEIINQVTGGSLRTYGLIPRHIDRLYGIFTAPILHGGLAHLLGNTIPLLVLGFLVSQTRSLLFVSLFVVIAGGLMVWFFGRANIHIGASGLIMGYWGFLLSYGWFTRSIRGILISIFTLLFYGGLIFTLLDFREHISFEGHIAGFISGVLCAWTLTKFMKQKTSTY